MAEQLLLCLGRVLDSNGLIVPGAKAHIYSAGTLTEIDVFTDTAGTIIATNPIVADAAGLFPQRYVVEAAKAVITDADDVSVMTLDPVPTTSGDGAQASQVEFAPSVTIPAANVQSAIELVDENARSRDAALGDLAALDTITTAQIAASALVTEAEGLGSSDNDTSIPTTAAVKDYVDDNAIGVGQTAQELSATRALATTYQNTTGKTLFVSVSVSGNGAAGTGDFLVGATAGTLVINASMSCTAASVVSSASLMVPAGWHYRVNTASGVIAIYKWHELRA